MPTKTDVAAPDWRINDSPFQLRHWASAVTHPLPAKPGEELIIGAGNDAQLRLPDPKVLISRKHASVVRDGERFALRDLNSKNGTWVDGVRRALTLLEPGLEIRIGDTTLVAESQRLVDLRSFVSRMLGWQPDALERVDLALRALRAAAARRTPLVLCGAGDLPSLAFDLHRRTHGADRPFVVCDPRRRRGEATVRSASSVGSGLAAIEAARGGTVCIWAKRRPSDFAALVGATRDPAARVQLVVCGEAPSQCKAFEVAPVIVPAISSRAAELPRILDEYERDARELLGGTASLNPMDREWIAARSASALSEVATATLRLVALRQAGSVNAAAELLGMSHTSLLRWLGRRKLFATSTKRRSA